MEIRKRIAGLVCALSMALAGLLVLSSVNAPAAEAAVTAGCKSSSKTYYLSSGPPLRIGVHRASINVCWGTNGRVTDVSYSGDTNATVPAAATGWQVEEYSPYISHGGVGTASVTVVFPGYARVCLATYTPVCGKSSTYSSRAVFNAPAFIGPSPTNPTWSIWQTGSQGGGLNFHTTI